MKRLCLWLVLFAALGLGPGLRGMAWAQAPNGRAAALDDLGRGTCGVSGRRHRRGDAALVRGDPAVPPELATAISKRRRWRGAARPTGSPAIAATPSSDLQAALAKAEQSGDQALIAAASGALGNLAFMSHRTATAEPLLQRSRDLAGRAT